MLVRFAPHRLPMPWSSSSSSLRRLLSHWLPAVAVALLGSLGTWAVWSYQQGLRQELVQERFAAKSQAFLDALRRHVDAQVDLLSGLRALLSVNPNLSRRDFEWAVNQLDIVRTHPSVAHADFVRAVPAAQLQAFETQARGDGHLSGRSPERYVVHPARTLPEYFVVDFVWPVAGNEDQLGLELHAQPSNLEAFARARRTGQLAASAPTEQPYGVGVTLRLPVFDHANDGDMQTGFIGTVALTLRLSSVVEVLRANGQLKGLSLTLDDAGLVAATWKVPTQPLAAYGDAAWDARTGRETILPLGGRRWQARLMPGDELLSATERSRPAAAASIAALVTVLLTALVALLSLRRLQAQAAAQAAHLAQQSSDERFRAVFNQAAVGIVQFDSVTGRVQRANRRFCEMLGRTEAALRQASASDYTDPRDLAASRASLRKLVSGAVPEVREEQRYLRADGSVLWTDVAVTLLHVVGADAPSHLMVVQDITERKHMQETLARSERHLRDILNHMPVGVAQVEGGRVMFLNERFVQICGYDKDEAPDADHWWRLVVPDEQERARARGVWTRSRKAAQMQADGAIHPVEFELTARDGTCRPVELSGMALGDSRVLVLVDQSQRRNAEQEIAYLAQTDLLTGLANRRLLQDRLGQALARSARFERHGAVLMLGLDRFKIINETLGHDVGDRLLALVALRIRAQVNAEDTVARHGGDAFVIVLGDLARDAREAAAAAEDLASALLAAVDEPFDLGGGRDLLRTTLSVGITLFWGREVSADELIKRSDVAMYAAKAAGRHTLRFFDPAMQATIAERVQLERDMREGLAAGQFLLHYQPKMQRGRIVGAEALVRWQHPARGLVRPAQFIALAEESGLITVLGKWVMQSACEQLARWSSHPVFSDLSVAVNVSAVQFRQDGFVAEVLALLASTGAPPRSLKLELTESMLLQDIEGTIAKMAQLKRYGVNFSLDDFGTGYSSLSYLKRLPLDELKIDQSFVRHVLSDPNEAAIARAIITLGENLGLQVTAEGVETEEQRVFLERNGCDQWQGYLLSKPVVLQDFEALVLERAAHQPRPGGSF